MEITVEIKPEKVSFIKDTVVCDKGVLRNEHVDEVSKKELN